MKFVGVLCFLCVRIALSHTINHWMVTETGLIQPKENSPFLMANPFDLLSFLNQDTRWQNIVNIYYILLHRQTNINKLWTKLEEEAKFDKHIADNEFCQRVGNIDILDWYTSFLEDGRFRGIPEKDYLLQSHKYGDTKVPDCKKISSLTFSMFAFEHLDSMINRDHLNATPEFTLPEMFSPIMTVDQFGDWLSNILRKNSSSWLHYNLAAIYWRVKGNVPKALECSRRAVHYAPRQFKNIALLCLGTILHRSRKTDDAIVVLGAAVDHDPTFPISQFALGGALAVRGDFNTALKHLDISIKLQSKFELAEKFRNGVLCHLDMFMKIHTTQSTIDTLSKEISEYAELEYQWLKYQTAFLKTMKHNGEYDYKNIDKNCVKMGEISGLKIKELKIDGDRNALVKYFIGSPTYTEEWKIERGVTSLGTAFSLQRIIKHIGTHAGLPTNKMVDETRNKTEILKEIGPMPSFPDIFPDLKLYKPHKKTEFRIEKEKFETEGRIEMGTLRPDAGKPLYPTNLKVNRNRENFDIDPEWPDVKFCTDNAEDFPDKIDAVYPVFIPFENKGIRLSYLLTEKIGVPALVEHELPWHPPICPQDKDLAIYTQKKGTKLQWVDERTSREILRWHLLRYLSDTHMNIVKNMQDAEIGQRIHTAIRKKVAPKWILYTIASLYWRVRGNSANALNCLLNAARSGAQYRDVVLVSTASVFLEMGLLEDATETAEDAYRVNSYEPATNFLLAQINMIKRSPPGHMFHLKQTIRLDPSFMGGRARPILNGWACVQMQVNTLVEATDPLEAKAVCAQVQPGVSMVCEIGGRNCHIANRNCKNMKHESNTRTFVRVLELRDNFIRGTPDDYLDDRIFNKYMDAISVDPTNFVFHRRNLDSMLKTLDKITRGCGRKTCRPLKAEDLNLTEGDCSFEELRLEYWLQILSFQQQMDDIISELPVDFMSLPPSTRTEPDCPLPPIDDFFYAQILNVDIDDWRPVPNLIHQFSEVYTLYDYAILGSKIAKYVEDSPQSWVGALTAGWWCGAGGRGACAVRCLANAYLLAPRGSRRHALNALSALLLMQSKLSDGKDIAYLMLYMAPKSEMEAFATAMAHSYNYEYVQAIWMYRYALTFEENFIPAKACLHISMCLMIFGDAQKKKANRTAV